MSTPVLINVHELRGGYRKGGWGRGRRKVHERLRGVSLNIGAGRVFGLAGESGSGKSTLARSLAQLLTLTGGTIRLHGEDISLHRSPAQIRARRRIQLVFQDPATALSPRRTVRQLLKEPAQHFSLEDTEGRLAGLLEEVGLDRGSLDRFPAQFSAGQRQRIAIARALICDPDLLIADEILSPLDVSVQARILQLLRRLTRERGLGLLLISHDLAMLRTIADEVGVMYSGRLVEVGPVDRIFNRPAHPYTRMLLDALPRLEPSDRPSPSWVQGGLAGEALQAGCPYARRCDRSRDRCRREPNAQILGTQDSEAGPVHGVEHRVECHFPLES